MIMMKNKQDLHDSFVVEVKAHVPGRLRLKKKIKDDPVWDEVLSELQREGKIDTFINKMWSPSIIIGYDAGSWSREAVEEVVLSAIMQGEAVEYLHQERIEEEQKHAHREKIEVLPKKVDPEIARQELIRATEWEIRSDVSGRMRVRHPALFRYSRVMQEVEMAMVNLIGVNEYSASSLTASLLVQYDTHKLDRKELLEVLDESLQSAFDKAEGGALEVDTSMQQLSLSTVCVGLASAAPFVPALLPVALGATAFASMGIFSAGFNAAVKEKKIKVDILDGIVIGLSLVSGHAVAASTMLWIVDLSDALLSSSAVESRKLMTKVFGGEVRKAWKLVDDSEIEVRISELEVGDLVVVNAGDLVPVDGDVVEGEAMVDQQALTGESVPAEKESGDEVFAMTFLQSGRIVVKATRLGAETNAAKVARVVEESMDHKVNVQSAGEKFADMMVLPTLAMGAVGFGIHGSAAAIAIINADFGTGIRMAAPVAVMASLSRAAKQGIIIKNSAVLEQLSQMDAVLFDKTGTLTDDTPTVLDVISVDPRFSDEQVLAFVASAETRFSHPIATALVDEAKKRKLELIDFDDTNCHIGYGVEVEIEQGTLRVGSYRYMEREKITLPDGMEEEIQKLEGKGHSVVFAAINEQMVGLIELENSQRAEAEMVIRKLKEKGKLVYLISGDREGATKDIAERLGIDNYFAEVLPEDKERCVQGLQAQGLKVAMVGDGINDAAALARSDYSISMRGATDIATDVSDIVFMDGTLAQFHLLFEISESLHKNVRRSMGLIVLPNVLGIAGAMFGVVGIGASLLLNNGFNLLATLNGMLPYYAALEELEESEPEVLDSETSHQQKLNAA